MANHTFTWPAGPKSVIVTGDFDDWKGSLHLVKQEEGDFLLSVPLGTCKRSSLSPPSSSPTEKDKIYFKFIVDGEWIVSDKFKKDSLTGPENNYISLGALSGEENEGALGVQKQVPKAQPAPGSRRGKKSKKKKKRVRRSKKTGEERSEGLLSSSDEGSGTESSSLSANESSSSPSGGTSLSSSGSTVGGVTTGRVALEDVSGGSAGMGAVAASGGHAAARKAKADKTAQGAIQSDTEKQPTAAVSASQIAAGIGGHSAHNKGPLYLALAPEGETAEKSDRPEGLGDKAPNGHHEKEESVEIPEKEQKKEEKPKWDESKPLALNPNNDLKSKSLNWSSKGKASGEVPLPLEYTLGPGPVIPTTPGQLRALNQGRGETYKDMNKDNTEPKDEIVNTQEEPPTESPTETSKETEAKQEAKQEPKEVSNAATQEKQKEDEPYKVAVITPKEAVEEAAPLDTSKKEQLLTEELPKEGPLEKEPKVVSALADAKKEIPSKDVSKEATPKKQSTSDTPKRSTPVVTPRKEATPEFTPKQDTPKEEPKKETPKEQPKKEVTPVATPKKDTPKEEPKKDTPVATPKKDTPKEEPKKETPKEQPKKEVTPVATPKKDTPKEEPKEEPKKEVTPVATPKKDTPKEQPKRVESQRLTPKRVESERLTPRRAESQRSTPKEGPSKVTPGPTPNRYEKPVGGTAEDKFGTEAKPQKSPKESLPVGTTLDPNASDKLSEKKTSESEHSRSNSAFAVVDQSSTTALQNSNNAESLLPKTANDANDSTHLDAQSSQPSEVKSFGPSMRNRSVVTPANESNGEPSSKTDYFVAAEGLAPSLQSNHEISKGSATSPVTTAASKKSVDSNMRPSSKSSSTPSSQKAGSEPKRRSGFFARLKRLLR